jgi:hypothetical protein
MRVRPDNPQSNNLPPGLTETQVAEAVKKSGYPLQIVVAELLKPQFGVQQEWSYIDEDGDQLRSLDVVAERPLYEFSNENRPRIRPTLDLLVECKQSDMPFVFFLTSERMLGFEFPRTAGLFQENIKISTDDNPSTWTLPINRVLDLVKEPFIVDSVDYCATFSKCVRKGSSIELSGTDAFHGIILPLIKALKHFLRHERPPETAFYHDLHLVLPVAVLDAPMIAVQVTNAGNELVQTPWIRVVRHESEDNETLTQRSHLYAVDVVHRDFFAEWLTKHVTPYAEKFAAAALRHQTELATGAGYAAGMRKNSWGSIESRLRPRLLADRVERVGLVAKTIGRVVRALIGTRKK